MCRFIEGFCCEAKSFVDVIIEIADMMQKMNIRYIIELDGWLRAVVQHGLIQFALLHQICFTGRDC